MTANEKQPINELITVPIIYKIVACVIFVDVDAVGNVCDDEERLKLFVHIYSSLLLISSNKTSVSDSL
jgi:hypothetical protein